MLRDRIALAVCLCLVLSFAFASTSDAARRENQPTIYPAVKTECPAKPIKCPVAATIPCVPD